MEKVKTNIRIFDMDEKLKVIFLMCARAIGGEKISS